MRYSATVRALAALGVLLPAAAHAQAPRSAEEQAAIQRQLDEIRAMRQDMSRQMGELDARIDALEAQLQPPGAVAAAPPPDEIAAPAPETLPSPFRAAGKAVGGRYEPGKGVVLARSDVGELDFSVFGYARYINQDSLDPTYTDSFGRTSVIDRREDVQLNKVMLYFKGWAIDPKLRYLFYGWTANSSQGQGAQVVIGGNLSYRFNDYVTLGAGIASLPSTRSTNWSFPNWLKVDHRTIGDEFFRASYTTGFFADGELLPGLQYRAMLGNNLSQLGVDAGQLDDGLNTASVAIWWMPTTGEYGPGQGFGDFEQHDRVATLLGVHFTRSREDAESQPGVNDFENTQLRLSDGARIFQPGAFATDGQITKATYRMLALDAGIKYRGWSLDGEYYFRWLDDFQTVGFIPVDDLYDTGFQVQASVMAIPKKLQVYLAASKIYGEYGNPGDVGVGVNWFPFARREFRVNAQALYLNDSPVGYTSAPWAVGGNGWVFTTDLLLNF